MYDKLQDFLNFAQWEYLQNWQVPVYVDNWDSCYWTTMTLPVWTIDCTFVQWCMQSIVDNINATLTNFSSRITSLEMNMTTVLWYDDHSHTNKAVLDWIINSWTANFYLWADWLYHNVWDRYWYYNRLETTWGWTFAQEEILAFNDSQFIITEDHANWRTIIWINPWILWWGGWWTADWNDYATSGSYDATLNTITITRTNGSFVFPLTWLTAADELVKVWWTTATAKYLWTNTFDNTLPTVEVKTQMSVTSNASGLMLVGDVLSPWPNQKYWTDALWNKWFFPDLWSGQITTTVLSQNTVTVTHNLAKYPTVICIDTNWYEVIPSTIKHTSNNDLTVEFSPVFSWQIVCS